MSDFAWRSRRCGKLNGLYRNLRSVAGPEQTVKMQSAVKKDLLQFYTHIIENNADDHRFAYEVAECCFFMWALSSSVNPVPSDRLSSRPGPV